MDVSFLTVKLFPGPEGYGINFRNASPVIVDTVLPGSLAERAGLKYGDFMVELNGNDIQAFTKESVISAIKSSNNRGGGVEVRVGRVRPLPVTPDDKKEAIQLIKQKLMAGEGDRKPTEYTKYEETVKNSLLEVADLLGSFDLEPTAFKTAPSSKPHPPPTSTQPPSFAAPSQGRGRNSRGGGGGGFSHEVEVPLYDSDSLPSPPSSHTSEDNGGKAIQELDALLDFTRDDEFSYNPGYAPRAKEEAPRDFTEEGFEGPRMMKAMLQAKHGIEGIKELMSEVQEKKRQKNKTPQVSTVATFTPSTSAAASTGPQSPRQQSPRQQSSYAPPSSSQGSKYVAATPPKVSSPIDSRPPLPVPASPVRTTPTSFSSSSSTPGSRYPVSAPPNAGSPIDSRPPLPIPASPVRATPPHSATTPTSPIKSPHFASSPTTSRPHPLSSSRQPESSSVRNPTTSPSRSSSTSKHRKWEEPVSEAAPPPLPTASHPSRSYAHRQESETPPPPIPPYNPSHPDQFLLSNKEDYRLEYKQQTHPYEPVDKEEVRNLQRNAQGRVPLVPPSHVGGSAGGIPEMSFLQSRCHQDEVVAMATNNVGEGHHNHGEGGRVQGRGEREMAITDLAGMEEACQGLPTNVYDWQHEEVLQWLNQLSPLLSSLYGSNFVKHDITGRTLLRLNMNKIKSMGIDGVKHRRVLMMEVSRLKVRQEKMELEELQTVNGNQLSYL